jgi:heat shock protein HslJ
VAPFSAPQITGDTAKYISAVEGRTLIATIVDRTCADTMTGMPYPRTVTVLFGDQEFRGCGGSPAGLLQGVEWTVENLNGRAIAGSSRGTLIFAPDGVLSGRSFCNSYRGRYALTGEGLTISLGASTLMGCPPEIMDQEKLFTDLLAAVRRFEAGAGGALILHTGDGRYIRLRRQ